MKANKKIQRKKRMTLWAAGIDDIAALSRIIGKSRTWTTLVLYGDKKSEPTRLAILKALHDRGVEVEYDNLWPNNTHPRKRAA